MGICSIKTADSIASSSILYSPRQNRVIGQQLLLDTAVLDPVRVLHCRIEAHVGNAQLVSKSYDFIHILFILRGQYDSNRDVAELRYSPDVLDNLDPGTLDSAGHLVSLFGGNCVKRNREIVDSADPEFPIEI